MKMLQKHTFEHCLTDIVLSSDNSSPAVHPFPAFQ